MAYENPGKRISLLAAADYSTKQFYAMTLDTTAGGAKALLASSAGQDIIGVLQGKPTSGQNADIMIDGITKAVCGTGGMTAGDNLMVTAAGAFTTATTGGTKQVVAKALKTAVAGDIVEILLLRGAPFLA
jgi:hypothetical protein